MIYRYLVSSSTCSSLTKLYISRHAPILQEPEILIKNVKFTEFLKSSLLLSIDHTKNIHYLNDVKNNPLAEDVKTEKDITNRLHKAKSSFHQLNKIWRSSNIGEKTKIRLYQSNILSVLLYGAECWRLTQKDNQRLSGFHTKCLRKI